MFVLSRKLWLNMVFVVMLMIGRWIYVVMFVRLNDLLSIYGENCVICLKVLIVCGRCFLMCVFILLLILLLKNVFV